jgi:NMD protein affecting ribosome stability and mRNA decay
MNTERRTTKVCGDCYLVLRPTEYVPDTYNTGECARCGDQAFTYRVGRSELESLGDRAGHVTGGTFAQQVKG